MTDCEIGHFILFYYIVFGFQTVSSFPKLFNLRQLTTSLYIGSAVLYIHYFRFKPLDTLPGCINQPSGIACFCGDRCVMRVASPLQQACLKLSLSFKISQNVILCYRFLKSWFIVFAKGHSI